MRLALTAAFVLIPRLALADLTGPPDGQPQARAVYDFIKEFDGAKQTNTLPAVINENARTDQVLMPAINIHPKGEGDSVVAYGNVLIPSVAEGERVFLTCHLGMSDGIQWEHELEPNGVRFGIAVEGELLWSEEIAEMGWRARAVDVTRWNGHGVAIEFRSNAIDGNAAYDWALVGRPQLVKITPARDISNLNEDNVGVAVGLVTCAEPSQIVLSMGETTNEASLPPGMHWLPLHVSRMDEVKLDVESGDATLETVLAAPYGYQVHVSGGRLGTPQVAAGQPFSYSAMVHNIGMGVYPGGARLVIECTPSSGESQTKQLELPRLGPKENAQPKWAEIVVDTPGRVELRCAILEDDSPSRPMTGTIVMEEEPPLPARRPRGRQVRANVGERLVGIAANRWSRISLIEHDGFIVCGIAETWNGTAWQRIGTVDTQPWLTACIDGGNAEGRILRITSVAARGDELVVMASDGEAFDVKTTYRPHRTTPRIDVACELTARADVGLAKFVGPGLRPGDHAYGAEKDFAIFPGLEDLTADERSSSTRDLVPPLNDRRRPEPYKIAAPIMAVEGQGSLAALLWDANQEWADGHRRPGVEFNVPPPGSWQDYSEMRLRAPGSHGWTPEGGPATTYPLEMTTGQTIRLEATLVLDHKSRYPKNHMVHGPHDGALVLQAIDHYTDVYGLPEPSLQPRTWDEQRALSREAYLETVWSEDPPGWKSHTAAESETNLKITPILLHEIAQGVDAETEAELKRRIDLVTERALDEDGVGALLSSNRFFLPAFVGHVPEGLKQYKARALGVMASREDGLWVWRTNSRKHRTLGVQGTHTLGQAAFPSLCSLWAARYTGDPEIIGQALDAIRQMEQYEIPRGSSMWECPQYQPDLLAAALAIKAYVEAHRITGDESHIDHARYWAWTGLPFLYLWDMDDYPTMRYNSIGVVGSTFFTHSWIGRPVVWMGLDYAIAIEELAEHDDSQPWLTIAQGITNSAMWQQMEEGEFKGLVPDSWEMETNTPNPSYINPVAVLHSEYRLRGMSPHMRCARIDEETGPVFINAVADVSKVQGAPSDGRLRFYLRGLPRLTTRTVVTQVDEPTRVSLGERAADSEALLALSNGWQYDKELRVLVLKHEMPTTGVRIDIQW